MVLKTLAKEAATSGRNRQLALQLVPHSRLFRCSTIKNCRTMKGTRIEEGMTGVRWLFSPVCCHDIVR